MPVDGSIRATGEGLPVARERATGTAIVVYRFVEGDLELLLLHRAHEGPTYDGDWAWGPPAGKRYPREPIDDCARRELLEETGLRLPVRGTAIGSGGFPVYVAEAPEGAEVRLSDEHDRHQWVGAEEAVARCRPQVVAHSLRRTIAYIRGLSRWPRLEELRAARR